MLLKISWLKEWCDSHSKLSDGEQIAVCRRKLLEEGYAHVSQIVEPNQLKDFHSRFEEKLGKWSDELQVPQDYYLRCVNRWSNPLSGDTAFDAILKDVKMFLQAVLCMNVESCQASVIWKDAMANLRVPFHQDFPYSQSYDVSAWVALQHVSEDDGAMEYVAGSHTWEIQPKVDFWAPEFEETDVIKEYGLPAKGNVVAVARGDVVFHFASTWHASRAFVSDIPKAHRGAVVLRFKMDQSLFNIGESISCVRSSMTSYGMDSSSKVLDLLSHKLGISEELLSLIEDDYLKECIRRLYVLLRAREHGGEDSFGRIYKDLWTCLKEIKYGFIDGKPDFACRPYTKEELRAILEHHIPECHASTSGQPLAVIVSGLPACGKTSCSGALLKSLRLNCITIDCDKIRHFHAQFRKVLGKERSKVPKDLIEWFMIGTDFEKTMFQHPESLMQAIIREKRSFCLHAVCDKNGNLQFMKYLSEQGYQLGFIHIEVPLESACARAERRAYESGRWTSRRFIESRAVGIREMFGPMAHFVLSKAGFVIVLDNEAENANPRYVWSMPQLLSCPFQTQREDIQGHLRLNLFHNLEERVRSFALVLLRPIFALLGRSKQRLNFALAGGCFKSLLVARAPRDLDIWPLSEECRDTFNSLLSGFSAIQGYYNTEYELPWTKVEVVRQVHDSLRQVLQGFLFFLFLVSVSLILICRI